MYRAYIDLLKIIAKGDRKGLFIRGLTVVLNSSIPPMTAYLLSKIVFYLGENSFNRSAVYLFAYLALLVSWNVFSRYSGTISNRLNDKLVIRLREKMVDWHREIPQDIIESPEFIKLREGGNVFLTTYSLRFFSTSERLITIVITLINYLILFFKVHPLFVLIVLAASVPGFMCRAKFVPEMRRMYEELQEDRSYQSYYKDMLTNPSTLKELRVWELERAFYSRYLRLTQKVLKRQTNHYYRHGFIGGGIESLAFGIGIMGSILLGVYLMSSGAIFIDGFVLIINSILDVQDTFISTFYNILSYKESACYAKDYLQIYYLAQKKNDVSQVKKSAVPDGSIVFKNVSFQYPSSKKLAVDHVNVVIRQGEKIAIVGENGSGKSTFCKLLLGLYCPSDGVMEYPAQFEPSVTFQDYCKYSLSVRDNVVIDRPEAVDDAKIKRAFRISGFDEVCSNSDINLDTKLGTVSGEGVNLSGGEWQRLAISRCFYDNKRDVIVLDEPHASLDPVAEVNMYQYYKNIVGFEKKCFIFVTHRLTSAKMCDRIIVFHKGKIVEDGTHSELLNRQGFYYKLYTTQAENYPELS